MPNNYIITCGTSQLEVDKLTGLSYSRDEAERFIEGMETSTLSP